MILDRGQRDSERTGHLTVRFTNRNPARHLPFAAGENTEPIIWATADHGHNPIDAPLEANVVPATMQRGDLGRRKPTTLDQCIDQAVYTTADLAVGPHSHTVHRTGGRAMNHDTLIAEYYAAMRIGAEAEDSIMALFTEDAVYSDPFGDTTDRAEGIDAIRDRFAAGWSFNPPDLVLDVLTVEIDGNRASATWECRSTAFPQPMQGRDEYRFRNGRIAELHVQLLQPDGP